jgi:hypothetical protein
LACEWPEAVLGVSAPALPLSFLGYRGLALACLGDGRAYTLALHHPYLLPGSMYQVNFTPPAGEWCTIELDFESFVLKRHGQRVGMSPLKPKQITGLSLFFAERQVGAFRLELRGILLLP